MRPFGYSENDERRREDYERNRMSSGNFGGSRYGALDYSGRYGSTGGQGYGQGGSYYRGGYDCSRYGRGQSVPGRYDSDRYFQGDQFGKGYYQGDQYGRRSYQDDMYGRSRSLDNRSYYERAQRYRSPSTAQRFDNYQSPDRYGFGRSSRYLSGPDYADREFRGRYDDLERDERFGRQYGRQYDGYYNQQKYGGSSVARYSSDKNFSQFGSGMDRYGNGYDRFDRSGQSYGYGQNQSRGFNRLMSGSGRNFFNQYRQGYGSDRQGYGGDRQGYGIDRQGYGFDRQGFGSDRQGYGNDRQGYGSDRQGFRNDRQGYGYDRQASGYERQGFGNDRYGLNRFDRFNQGYGNERFGSGSDRYYSNSNRFGYEDGRQYFGDRSRFGKSNFGYENDRSGYGPNLNRSYGYGQYRFGRQSSSADRFDQPGRVRFEGEEFGRRQSAMDSSSNQYRRASISEPFSRREYSKSEERRDVSPGRRFTDDMGLPRESQYRTEGLSNMNRRFEPFNYERRSSKSYPSGSSEVRFDMQGGNEYQGGGQFGSQFGRDRMPPPIPPFSEPRSSYPATMALSWYDGSDRYNQNSTNRCKEMAVRASYDLMRRRYYESAADPSQNPTWLQRGGYGNAYNLANVSPDVLRMDYVDFYPLENAKDSRTFEYEIVRDSEQPNPVLRRGESFRMSFTFRDREFDESRDFIYLNFYFGPNPSVPKRTRVVLPVNMNSGKEFERAPHQWDTRFLGQEGNKFNVEVYTPSTAPVGMWRCVVETSTREAQSSRLQYRCPEDIYVIFNPFCRDDAVWMENDSQRFEYVMNDSGKVYTGGYRNVRGRPWIYGQFDDSVLPAACLLLEMSGLPHSERGNPVKVSRALASMIKASKNDGRFGSFFDGTSNNFGLVEAKYEDEFRGGNTPHLWTGSVQIIEEFLRGGATPVKYAQCWVISALMTSLCRALGMPSRPVTAFVSALETQDSLTIDRYVDRFGDIIEKGPSQDQPDSIWSFHTWCDVWMNRPDQPNVYSGWQATDPCRSFRDFRDLFSGACGPCPVEALRRGDVGQRDDVDAFYASLNAYVRYFYEDDESGWGYSPFRQFRYPMSRYILTKAVGRYDEEGDNDCDDLTNVYRDNERSDSEKFAIFNACRGFNKDMPSFEYQAAAFNWGPFNPNESDQSNFDVSFELDAPERVMVGQAVTIPVVISNNSSESRNIQTNICTRSSFYTGVCGPFLKRSSTQLNLSPNQQETLTLTLDPWDYMDKLVDMAFIKITVTSFVQETGQSFIDEFDFRFNKPSLNIDVGDLRVGVENEATFSFMNPLDVPLTDCFLTMEVSGSVRPRTIRISREVGPRECFTYRQTFTPRFPGEHRMVACFASRQLQDVVGQRSVNVREA